MNTDHVAFATTRFLEPGTPISIDLDDQGILSVCIENRIGGAARLDTPFLNLLFGAIDQLATDSRVTGMILWSRSPDFGLLFDIDDHLNEDDPRVLTEQASEWHLWLRRMENCGKPVVAILQGRTIGPGLELALAAHHRVAVDDGQLRLGFPLIHLGLMPRGGGTQRLLRLIGLESTVDWLLSGKLLQAHEVLEMDLVGELSPWSSDLMTTARRWCLAHPHPRQSWDSVQAPEFAAQPLIPSLHPRWPLWAASVTRLHKGHHPAAQCLLSALYEGGLLQFEPALEVETRYFIASLLAPETRRRLEVQWRQKRHMLAGVSGPELDWALQCAVAHLPSRHLMPQSGRSQRDLLLQMQDEHSAAGRNAVMAYVTEGIAMLTEGIAAACIEAAGRDSGMPLPPLAWADALSLDYVAQWLQLEATGADSADEHPALSAVQWMIHAARRTGSGGGRGFYDGGADPALWPGLELHFEPAPIMPDQDELIERLLLVQSLAVARSLQTQEYSSAAQANLASIEIWGFPAWRGGAWHYAMDAGAAALEWRCHVLASRLGRRFAAPQNIA